MQQSGFNDMQLFQQQLMFKRYQELQRQQQLHQLGDVRQQNSLNQHPNVTKQFGGQLSPLFNGTPVNDTQQMLRHLMQRGGSPAQGMSNKVLFPYDQAQAYHSMGLAQPQLDESFYGAPVSSSRINMVQYPHLQGTSHDPVNLMPKSGGQAQKPMMQISDFGNTYLGGDQSSVPSDLASLSQQALTSKLESQVKDNVGHIPIQDLNGGAFPGNFQGVNAPDLSSSMKEFSEREEPSGGSLDPLEAKILYDMDGNIWDAFGGRPDTGSGGFGHALEQLDSSNAFPSIQSGSWSALMQSAVAETSSTDTGVPEEWSGLMFQNTDHSTDNQMPNFIDSNKQHSSWADNNLQGTGSKHLHVIDNSNNSSNFHTLERPDMLGEKPCHTGVHEIFRNISDFHVSKGLSNSETGFSPEFQGNARASEEVADRGDDVRNSSTFCESVLPDGRNVTVQTSEQMLELLHKVDQSRVDSTMKDFGSTDSSLLCGVPSADTHEASVAQPYTETSSQGAGLRLGPPSQKLQNANNFFASQGIPHTQSGINLTPENTETGNRIQTVSSPTVSYPLMQPSHELSQRAQWDNKAAIRQTVLPSSLNVQGNYVASSALNAPHRNNQLDTLATSNVLAASQPLNASVPGGNRFLPSDQSFSQDPSKNFHINSSGQQFPILDALSMSQDSGISARAMNVWRSVTNPRQPSSNETSKQQVLSKMLEASHSSAVPQGLKQDSDATALISGLLGSDSLQDDLNRVRHGNNIDQASDRNLEVSGHLQNQYQNFSEFHQVQTVHNGADPVSETPQVTALAGQLLSSGYVHPKDSVTDSASHPVPSADGKLLVVSRDAEDDPRFKIPLQSSLQFKPSLVAHGHSDSQTQSSAGDVPSSHSNHGQIHPHMAPTWFKQYGTLMSGQIMPVYNTGVDKTGASNSSFQKSNLHNHTSEMQLSGSGAVDGGMVLPNSAATLVATQKLPMSFVSPFDIANQVSIMKSKKRKITELLPWHKEVNQDAMRLEYTSMAEEDWARAANRLVEMVEDETEISEDTHPLPRARRRLIKTRQLMQQLFHPPPASVLSTDSTTGYDILSYFVTRLSMGDACSLSYRRRNNMFVTLNENDLNVDKQDNSDQTKEVFEKFVDTAKKLESEFQRLDKTASVVDIRVELLELERFSVINRFAKFHIRSQPDASGNSSSSATLKPHPQRYVSALPITRNLPEGVHCLSL